MLRLLSALLLCFPLLAQNSSLRTFFAETFAEQLRDDPEFATSIGRHEYDARWSDWSKAGRNERRTHLEQRLQRLRSFSLTKLNPEDRLSAQLLAYNLQLQLDSREVQDLLLRVMQQNGLHNNIYNTIDRMPARTPQDYENILARLRAVPAYIDQSIALLDEAAAQGLTQPRIVVDLVAGQLAAQIAQDSAHTPLLGAFHLFPATIAPAEQMRLRTQAVETYEKQFLPAWRKYREYLTGKYAQAARANPGLGSLSGGQAAYRNLVRLYTTTSMTPDEIHKLGLDEVQRIENEMRAVLRQARFAGSIAEYERQLDAAPEQHFHNEEEMLAYCRNVAKIVEPELPKQFLHIPQLLYGIRPIPAERAAATATNAQSPLPDYSAPGWMNLNTYQPEKQVKYNKEALVLHEAVPGHVFQITLAHTLAGLPEFRQFYTNSAYVEGWGLYAESLGAELGVYRDPASRFGQLASERFRAVRLVVDTGLHAMGWSRQQALDYFKTHVPDQSIAEVDRYISWPGQALSYKMGEIRIKQLRKQAEKKLGTRFDVRAFHDLVLRNGVLPLELLSQEVQASLQ